MGGGGNLLCFQSVGTPSLAFVAMNPFSLIQIMLLFCQMRNSTLWGVSSSQDLCYYVLCVVREPVGESTVNLKCPIVIHAEEKKAVQVILDTGTYHMRHRLSEFRSEEAGSVC